MKSIFEVNAICRLCLRVNEKVYRLDNTHHKAFIESLIKLKQFQHIPTDDDYVCYICNALITKTYNFMQTVWNAQEIISVLLENTDKITKPMLQSIDRHNNGLNPINLSSVVICENVKHENSDVDSNASTEIEELELDLLIDKTEGRSKKKQKHKNDCDLNIIENHSTNEKSQSVSSSSDEDKKPDKSNLYEVEIEIHDIKTETGDPLTKDFNTEPRATLEQQADPKTKPKKKLSIKKQHPMIKAISGGIGGKYKTKEEKDDDYQPDSTSHSEDSDYDSYDDEGKPIRRPKDHRVYPRKCDHCNYEVPKGHYHYRHYLWMHPNVVYPYKQERNYICSICGKPCTKAQIRRHEDNHASQKLKCTLCPNLYSNKLRLYRHMQTVHPKRKFTCDYCSKIFKTRSDIMRHIRTHTGSKPFKCHICGDGFAHSGNRIIHIRTKHQNYKYVPKKLKQVQKVCRNNKKSTDTENTSNNEQTLRRTKKKKKKNVKKRT